MLPTLETARLSLRPLTVPIIDALLSADASQFRALTSGAFPPDKAIPPLMDDALPYLRSRMVGHPRPDAWSWIGIDRARAEAVVAGGLGFGVDDRGVVTLGYSVYPRDEGRGYATEFARGLVAWAFERPEVAAVEATIPEGHAASIRVAAKAGMALAGRAIDDEVGEVLVYRRER